MTTAAAARVGSTPLVQQIEAASGARLALCFQCQKCTSGCPIAATTDIKPHELIRLVQLGEQREVLSSRMIWECTSCQTCVTRCPHAVGLPSMIDALRRLSRDAGRVAPDTNVPVFNDIFLGAVKRMGRVHELTLMAVFKLRARSFFQDAAKLPAMLRKGKLALKPTSVRGRAQRARTFRRVESVEGRKR